MHFATYQFSDENKEYHNWHCMPFREDFNQKLTKFGELPDPSIKKHFGMLQELKESKQMIDQITVEAR